MMSWPNFGCHLCYVFTPTIGWNDIRLPGRYTCSQSQTEGLYRGTIKGADIHDSSHSLRINHSGHTIKKALRQKTPVRTTNLVIIFFLFSVTMDQSRQDLCLGIDDQAATKATTGIVLSNNALHSCGFNINSAGPPLPPNPHRHKPQVLPKGLSLCPMPEPLILQWPGETRYFLS